MTESKKFALTMDLTPHFMSGYALRKQISDYRWRRIIKKEIVAARGLSCEICQFSTTQSKHIDAHEVFEYRADGTVRLAAIQLLCTRCHDIKDFAQIERLIAQGVKPAERQQIIVEHFCHVNECTPAEFHEHYEQAKHRVSEIENLYGPDIAPGCVSYGDYHGHYVAAKDPARLNEWTAAQHAIAVTIRDTVHEDYREDLLEIAKSDKPFAEELLRLVKADDYKAVKSLIVETLADYFFDDDSIISDDEPVFGRC